MKRFISNAAITELLEYLKETKDGEYAERVKESVGLWTSVAGICLLEPGDDRDGEELDGILVHYDCSIEVFGFNTDWGCMYVWTEPVEQNSEEHTWCLDLIRRLCKDE